MVEPFEKLRVELRSPFSHRAFRIFKAAFTILILGLCMTVAIMGTLVALWPSQPPDWAIAAGIILLVCFVGLLCWIFDRYESTRLILMDDRLWIGGRFFGRNVKYEEVRLIKRDAAERVIGKAQQIVLERRKRAPLQLWLAPKDADECFTTLRSLCDHAPAMDPEAIYQPENVAFAAEAQVALRREFMRSARRALCAVVVFGVLGACLAAGLIAGGSRRGWIGVSVLVMSTITASAKYADNRRRAQRVVQNDQ